MSLVIGLTGGIATGKSTVANKIKALNIPVIDADVIAREVVEPGKKAYDEIVAVFGTEILSEDRTINRKALGEIVFSQEAKREQLNAIVHPAIRKEMLQQRDMYKRKGYPCIVMDIPLLFESKLEDYVDKVIVVAITPEMQLARLMARDNSTESEAKARIQSQMPITAKLALADAVIDNNQTVENTYKQLKTILQQWQLRL